MMPVRLEPAAPLSLVKHSTTEPLRSLDKHFVNSNPGEQHFILGWNEKSEVAIDSWAVNSNLIVILLSNDSWLFIAI